MKCKKCGEKIPEEDLLNESAKIFSEYTAKILKEVFENMARASGAKVVKAGIITPLTGVE